jgi:class 3 adenylate cyclase
MRLVNHLENRQALRSWKTPLSNYACAIRPVAAIMITKIDGFDDLIEADHTAGITLLTKSHKLQEYYLSHHGCTRVVKMGDTILASFYSAAQAVQCAVKIQRGAQKMFNHSLRIGIHMGEVRYVKDDLFGTPVNIASDIQQLAKPGQVLVSESVARSIDPEVYAIGLQQTSEDNCPALFEVKSRIIDETSYIGYAESVDTRSIDHPGSWNAYAMVSGS